MKSDYWQCSMCDGWLNMENGYNTDCICHECDDREWYCEECDKELDCDERVRVRSAVANMPDDWHEHFLCGGCEHDKYID